MALRFLNSGYFAGKVGIGEQSPSARLQITTPFASSPSDSIFLFTNGSNTPGGGSEIIFGSSSSATPINYNAKIAGVRSSLDNGSSDLLFQTTHVSTATTPTTKIIIKSDGNVGIGTTTPNAKLDIQGTQGQLFSVTDDLSGEIFAVSDISGVPIMTVNSSGVSYFDGNVGIGTTSPSAKLEVAGTGELSFKINNTQYNRSLIIEQGGGYSHLKASHVSGIAINYGQGNPGILSLFNNTTQAVKINTNGTSYLNGGNVGIGTTSPGTLHGASYGTTRLHIDGGTSRGQMIIEGNNYVAIHLSDNTATANERVFATQVLDGKYQIKPLNDNGTSTVGGEAITVLHNSNVGIGTTLPGVKLEVVGDIKATNKIRVEDSSNSRLEFASSISNQARISAHKSNLGQTLPLLIQAEGIKFGTVGGGEKMRMDSTGNLGINTTSPDFKLDVDGTLGVSDLPFNTDSVSVLVADETIGADLVRNGDFATNTDWTEQGGAAAWSIANGKANCVVNSLTRYFEQPNVLPSSGPGNTYKVVYTISGITQGQFQINIGGYGATPGRTTNGTYAETFTTTNASANNRIYLQSSPNTIGSIDNISVQLVTSASNQIQKRELGTGAFGPTPVGAYLPLTAGSGSPLTGDLYIEEDSLYLLNASNNYWRVQNNSSGKLIFKQGTTQRGIWSSGELQLANNLIVDGNVGIGITSPGDKLHVEGGIIIQNGNNLQWGGLYSAGAPTIYASTNYLHFVPTGSSGSGYRQMRLDTTGLGIGTSSPSEKLDVAGNIKIQAALLSNQENTDIDTGAEVVAQVAHATYTAAFFDFVVKKGTNVRSGTVYACHDGDTTPLVEFTETSTNDLGDTSDVTLSVDISGANMRLLATVTSDDWSVKSLIRAI